jgi:hypothetical protein
MMAKVGSARPMFTIDTASSPPRRMWPSATAGGMATTAATTTASTESLMWAHVSAGSPRLPDQAASLDR